MSFRNSANIFGWLWPSHALESVLGVNVPSTFMVLVRMVPGSCMSTNRLFGLLAQTVGKIDYGHFGHMDILDPRCVSAFKRIGLGHATPLPPPIRPMIHSLKESSLLC